MSISSINYGSSVLGLSVQNLNNQLTNLSTELSTGEKSTTYSGMGVNEGFAVAARAQLSNITAFGTTMTNVNTIISAANTALQTLSDIGGQVQSSASTTPQDIGSTGQTVAQGNAASEFAALVGVLNTQVGDRYIFSGSAINTPAVASVDSIMNGTGTQAGLKQVMAQRLQADVGTNGMGRLVVSQPTPTSVQVGEDVAGSPFGLKLNSVSSTLTGATVTGPSGSPAAVSVDLGATNPNPGDQVNFTFNMPDGTTQTVQLTATNTTPPPAGSFAIGSSPTATAANLNTALTSSIKTVANTTLVAASAVEAGNNFFDTDTTATGTAASSQATGPVPASGSTLLSGATGNSLASGFAAGDTLTVNGTTISFNTTGTTAAGAHRPGTLYDRPRSTSSTVQRRPLGDRHDFGHDDPVDRQQRRRGHAERQCRHQPLGYKFGPGYFSRAGLPVPGSSPCRSNHHPRNRQHLRNRDRQPDHRTAADQRRHVLVRRSGHELADPQFWQRRHAHRQRQDHHVQHQCGDQHQRQWRCDQPQHRIGSGRSFGDRPDHGHLDAIDRQRRRD